MTDVTEATGALVAIANTLDRIEGLLRPLPPEIAEENVAPWVDGFDAMARKSAVWNLLEARGLVGDRTPLDRAVFVLPALNAEGALDTRLLRVGLVDQVQQWWEDDHEGEKELVDRIEGLVRSWVGEANA